MTISFAHHNHGKGKVRVVKVFREEADLKGKFGEINEDVRHYNVQTILYGPVEESYTKGNNQKVISTDTQKNTVYCVARDNKFKSSEHFAVLLSQHFLKQYQDSVVHEAHITIEEDIWARVEVGGHKHGHAFKKTGPCQKRVVATCSRNADGSTDLALKCGFQNFTLMKTTKSSWCDFLRDEYTTLPDAKDRLLGSSMQVEWEYNKEFVKGGLTAEFDWEGMVQRIEDSLTFTFCGPPGTGVASSGVQQTLHQMCYNALNDIEGLDSMWISAPNLHNIPFDFSKLGRAGHGDVYVATTEPHGLIEVKLVKRSTPQMIKSAL